MTMPVRDFYPAVGVDYSVHSIPATSVSPKTLPGFSLRPLCDTAVLVEHVFETTGSNRAQTHAVSQRGRRENLTQHSYSISSFKAKAHQALPRKP